MPIHTVSSVIFHWKLCNYFKIKPVSCFSTEVSFLNLSARFICILLLSQLSHNLELMLYILSDSSVLLYDIGTMSTTI